MFGSNSIELAFRKLHKRLQELVGVMVLEVFDENVTGASTRFEQILILIYGKGSLMIAKHAVFRSYQLIDEMLIC